jgi:hypothetical protein
MKDDWERVRELGYLGKWWEKGIGGGMVNWRILGLVGWNGGMLWVVWVGCIELDMCIGYEGSGGVLGIG